MSIDNHTVRNPAQPAARPRDAATVVVLPGDPRHPLPDVLGGAIRRFQLVEGRYRAVKAA